MQGVAPELPGNVGSASPSPDQRAAAVLPNGLTVPDAHSVTGHTVRYTQGGRSYDETITVGYRGSVSAAAAYIPPEPDELRCLKASGARLLPDLR